MKQFSRVLRKIISLKWYYQLLLALVIVVSAFALYKLLSWLLPFILGGLFLIGLFTEGEAFYMIWNNYKQSKQVPANPLYGNFYHWLTEVGVIGLPITTLEFTQGVEFPDIAQGIFYIHLKEPVSVNDQKFANFEMKARQTVKTMSNGNVDCIVSISEHDPSLAIKIRLISTNEMLIQNQYQHMEEDF